MSQKAFTVLAGAIFALIALGHVSRLIFQWPILLGGWAVPLWVNGVALLISGYLAYEGFRLGRKSP